MQASHRLQALVSDWLEWHLDTDMTNWNHETFAFSTRIGLMTRNRKWFVSHFSQPFLYRSALQSLPLWLTGRSCISTYHLSRSKSNFKVVVFLVCDVIIATDSIAHIRIGNEAMGNSDFVLCCALCSAFVGICLHLQRLQP
ncbi:hypothetical protein K443DRAFT_108477 [Laccaria amethystina LaAM-08-1]|uniref:Uncharacterized protein n=1 Tax=Laccaria amethystina LaAM-08-1 TaxID=1095629 RepID=A0A0C9XHL4_9AGAR|nr:hypothetical protein K443DRAFT_108477 [Laccaria amethystina LaAM-08-1]